VTARCGEAHSAAGLGKAAASTHFLIGCTN
jgi:hypothetical protein